MKRGEATNLFHGGMMSDLNPLVIPDSNMTHCLNGTIVTYNGNENVLQNDMGNGRVETAFLPEGYIPLGTTEFGGIIYIASYNPKLKRGQIGSFPSPERNQDTPVQGLQTMINESDFITRKENEPPLIHSLYKYYRVSDDIVHAGDKFIVGLIKETTNSLPSSENNYITTKGNYKQISLKLATIDNNNKVVYLKDLTNYSDTLLPFKGSDVSTKISDNESVDDYREKASLDYHIYTSKIAGQLYIIAELEVIDYIDVSYEIDSITNDYYGIKFFIDVHKTSNGKTISYLDITSSTGKLYTKAAEGGYQELNTISFGESDHQELVIYIERNQILEQPVKFNFLPAMKYGRLPIQFQKQLRIDLNSIGTNLVTSDYWRYYTLESHVKIDFNLNIYNTKQVESIIMEAICSDQFMNTQELTGTYLSWPIFVRSGSCTKNIPFNQGFKKNELYLIRFGIKFKDMQESVYVYHILYTNGVYNNTYTDNLGNPEYDNFDSVQLPLNYIVKVSQNKTLNAPTIKSLLTKNISESNKLYTDSSIVEATYQTVDAYPELENTFEDTFAFDIASKVLPKNNKSFDQFSISRSKENIINSGNVPTNSQFTLLDPKLQEQKDPIFPTEFEENTLHLYCYPQDYLYKGNNTVCSFKLKGRLVNKIDTTYTDKLYSVDNYIAPILNTEQDLLQYNMQIKESFQFRDTSNFIPSSKTFIALGMANGGRDNTGGGGLRHIKGTAALVDTQSDTRIKQVNSMATSDANGDGTPGYEYFPRYEFSEVISEYTKSPIVPVLMVGLGNRTIQDGEVVKESHRYLYTARNSGSSDRHASFNEAPESQFRTLWLFMKNNSPHEIAYVPTNMFFPIAHSDTTLASLSGYTTLEGPGAGDITTPNKGTGYNFSEDPLPSYNASSEFQKTMSDYIGNLLAQLYTRRVATEPVKKKGLQSYRYFDNVIYTLSFSTTIDIEKDVKAAEVGDIKFLNWKLTEILEKVKGYIDNQFCLRAPELSIKDYPINISWDFNLNYPEEEKDRFLLEANSSSLDTYVENNLVSDANISLPNESIFQGQLYYIVNSEDGRKLKLLDGDFTVLNYYNPIIIDSKIKFRSSSNKLLYKFNILNFPFTYNYRENAILLNTAILPEKKFIKFLSSDKAGMHATSIENINLVGPRDNNPTTNTDNTLIPIWSITNLYPHDE